MSDKIKPQHVGRKAMLYVRQSAAYQVNHNLESQRSCPHGPSALSRASCRHAGGFPHRFRGVERREETADDQVHADHGPFAAAL